MIIDTHVHLDNEKYYDDLDDVIKRAKQNGVERFIIPGADPQTLDRAIDISSKYDNVYFAVGVHPYDVDLFETLDFDKYVNHDKCVAIGECGLDYFRLKGDSAQKQQIKNRQKYVFQQQIMLAKQYHKPLILHIRDASNDAKEILIKNNAKEVGGVLHCYNADEQLLSLSKDNFYFGIGGVLTFKNAKKLVNVLPKIPLDKLLIETDAPYLTPEPYRGKRNEPAYTTFVVQKISELLDIDNTFISDITTKNAKQLFNIM